MNKATDPDPAQWLSGLFEAQSQAFKQFTAPGMVPGAAAPWQELAASFGAMQKAYLDQMTALWPGAVAAQDDKRFAGDAWRGDPSVEMATRTYQNYAASLRKAIDNAPLDDKVRGQWSFAARQLVDALSPANFLATNPEALRLVAETGGQSLVQGMNLLVQDLLKGRISMTDETAFEPGRNIATTEGDVIFENELIQLIHYKPLTDEVHERPLLMVPPCINKYYILDLQPENSLVRHALEQGQQVFLMSWRNGNAETAHLGWDDYLRDGVATGIDVTLEATGAKSLNALGFCMGGTMLSCAVAVMTPAQRARVKSLTLLTTMLDFVDTGELGLLVTEQSVASREQAIGERGLMHGSELALTFSSLRANDLIWPYVVNSYLKGKAPPAFDLLYWNSDATNLPGPMYCWYLRRTYLENSLKVPGATVQCDVPMDLGRLDMPAYLYASREDHIVPWKTAYTSGHALKGDLTFALGASGHIAGVINPARKNKRNYWVGPEPTIGADEWMAAATEVPGSWWPHWTAWLARHSGPRMAVPKRVTRGKYKPIEAAPGRYVKEKAE
jgi:polyhydroxyalkanoate synthase